MRVSATVRSALAAIAAAATLAAAPAFAQDAPKALSPLKVEADVNGVNVVTGKVQLPMPMLSVPAAPRLKFDWVQSAAPFVKRTLYGDQQAESDVAIQTTGAESASFHCLDTDCTGGSYETGSRYRPMVRQFTEAGSGEVYSFSLKSFDRLIGEKYYSLYYASTITYPDGETLTFSYDSAIVPGDTGYTYYRPNRIASSTGYYIKVTYDSTVFDPQSATSGTPRQATLYGASDPNTPLARLTYNGSTITDLAGRIYSCTGCANALDTPLETASGAMQLPGETSAAVQYAGSPVPGIPWVSVVQTVLKDGVQWNYAYTNPRAPNCPGPVATSGTYDKLTVTGPNGYNVAYDIEAASCNPASITKITDSLGRSTQYIYDVLHRPVDVTFPEQNGASVTYDVYANITTKVTRPKPGSGTNITESAFFDTANCVGVLCYRPSWVRDGLTRQTDYAYNPAGQVIEETAPPDRDGIRRRTYVTYEASTGMSRPSVVRICGLGTTCGTANEIRTEYSYWGNTLLPLTETRIDAAAGASLTTTYSYDPAGRLLSVDGPRPGTDDATYYRYDPAGRKIWEIGPKGANGLRNAKRFTYRDSDDKVTATETGSVTDLQNPVLTVLTRTDLAYDGHRNPEREMLSAAPSAGGAVQAVTDRSFDDSGRPVCTAVRMELASLPALGTACTARVPAPPAVPDRVTKNIYDAAGQLKEIWRAVGTSLEQRYAAYDYTPNGKQKWVTDANNNKAELRYDGFDRQSCWIFPSKTTPGQLGGDCDTLVGDFEAYGYDAAGNRTSLRKRDGTVLTYAYDALNRMVRKTVPASATGAAGYGVYYGYDVRGLQTYARFGSATGPGVTNGYDGFGRLASSTTNMDGVARALTSQYDENGNRTMLSGDAGYLAPFSYDAAGRMTGYASVTSFHYDAFGRPQGVDLGPGGAWATWHYDPAGRLDLLTHAIGGANQTLSFLYNPAGQIVTRTSANAAYDWAPPYNVSRNYQVNGLNQYTGTTGTGGTAYTYDANGNLASDGLTTFVYDAENRLVSATGARNATLSYDPLGRLWQVSSAATVTARFLYDGDRLVQEYDGSGAPVRSYVHGPGTDDPMVVYEAGGRRFLHTDHQGSIVAANDDAGNVAYINSYDPWGVRGASNQGRFGYTGQAWLPELGMYYYKARIYWPAIGRFMQTDPIGYEGGINIYAYGGNDPVDNTDPTGNYTCPEKDCPSVDKAVANLRVAAERTRMVTGSLIPSQASRTLNAFVQRLGKAGEDNGIRIENASLDPGMLGRTQGLASGGQLIQMDFGQINRAGGFPIAAAVIGHEMAHVAQNIRSGYARSLEELSYRERPAYRVGAWVLAGLRWHSSLFPNLGDSTFEKRVRELSKDNCLTAANSYEDTHNRWAMLPGNCR